MENIWEQTGLFLRKNTNDNSWDWAYRIDPSKMKVNLPSVLKVGDKFKLSEVVGYPEFFNIFPNAKNIDISVVKNSNNPFEFGIEPSKNKLTINLAYYDQNRSSQSEDRNGFAHEIQHYIQHVSESGGGTNVEKSIERTLAGIGREKSQITKELQQGTLSPIQEQDARKEIAKLNAMEKYLKSSKRTDYWVERIANELVAKNYDSHIGERESRFATTDFTTSPYEAYNKDAEKFGIAPIDFEEETKSLRNNKPLSFQNNQRNESPTQSKSFRTITQKAYDNLVARLKKAFPRMGNVIYDWNEFAAKVGLKGSFEDIIFSKELQGVNANFNHELQQLIDGTLPQGHIFQ